MAVAGAAAILSFELVGLDHVGGALILARCFVVLAGHFVFFVADKAVLFHRLYYSFKLSRPGPSLQVMKFKHLIIT